MQTLMNNFHDEARDRRIRIFEDTMSLCKTDDVLQDAVAKSIKEQVFICEDETLAEASTSKRNEHGVRVIVSRKRSLEAASTYIERGQRVCVHNFASATNPGGGVTRGSNAQEEAICRCSTLYPCLSAANMRNAFYDSHREKLQDGRMDAAYNGDCIYTPEVIVFKSDTAEPALLPEQDWYRVDMITCAAPNLRERPSNSMNPGSGTVRLQLSREQLKRLHVKRAS